MTPFDCVKCGAKHGMVIENMETGTQEPLDLCYNCIFSGCKYNPIPPHITVDEVMKSDKPLRQILLESRAELIEEMIENADLAHAKIKEIDEWLRSQPTTKDDDDQIG